MTIPQVLPSAPIPPGAKYIAPELAKQLNLGNNIQF